MCGNERSGPIAPGHTSALRIIICTPFSRLTVCVIRKFSANEHSIYASAHEISARLDQRDHPAQRNFHTNIQIGVHAHCDKTGWRLSLGVGHIQIPANGQAEPALKLDDWLDVPLRFFPRKRKKPPGFQGGSSNVDLALTRFAQARARLFRPDSKSLLSRGNLVAGVGFEPTTFRL